MRGSFALCAVVACIACSLWLAGCVTPVYYDVTDFTTVVIDAGHGGHDSGAATRGGKNRVLEKDLALDVARRLAPKLRAAGLQTVMTRRDDTFIALDERVRISNAQRKSIFVSIHFNDSRRRKVHGVETYHNGRGTPKLAGRIDRALASLSGAMDRGVKMANYRVLRKSRGPAVLVECGFLSNKEEANRCATAACRERIATQIAKAIIAQRQ